MLVLKNGKIVTEVRNNTAAIDAVIEETEKTSNWAGVLTVDDKDDVDADAVQFLENGCEVLTNGNFRYAPFKYSELDGMSVEEMNTLLSRAGLGEYSVES